jgi:hypothetical protein
MNSIEECSTATRADILFIFGKGFKTAKKYKMQYYMELSVISFNSSLHRQECSGMV